MATITTYTIRTKKIVTRMGERTIEEKDLARLREVPGDAADAVAKMMAAIPGMTHEVVRRQERGGGTSVEHVIRQTLASPIKGKQEGHGVLMYDTDKLVHVVTG